MCAFPSLSATPSPLRTQPRSLLTPATNSFKLPKVTNLKKYTFQFKIETFMPSEAEPTVASCTKIDHLQTKETLSQQPPWGLNAARVPRHLLTKVQQFFSEVLNTELLLVTWTACSNDGKKRNLSIFSLVAIPGQSRWLPRKASVTH